MENQDDGALHNAFICPAIPDVESQVESDLSCALHLRGRAYGVCKNGDEHRLFHYLSGLQVARTVC